MNISIVSGWLPLVVQVLTVALLILAVDWRGGWRRQLSWGVPIAAVTTGIVLLIGTVTSVLPSAVTWSTYTWGFTWILAVCVAVIGWSGGSWIRRSISVAAIVFTLLSTLGTVNQQSGAYPTVGRLVSLDPEHVLDNPQLRALQAATTLSGRLPAQGVVITAAIPPTVSHFATRLAYVYLPPAWFAKVTPHLPTLVLLPGEPGSAADWSGDGDADNTADAFAAAHDGVAPIIVMPDPNGMATEDSECVNSKFGNAETYLVTDVPVFVRHQFNASNGPDSLAIGGLSAGGTCAVMLALRHPDVYPTFASFSGFASPQYQDASLSATIDTLFGGSETNFSQHDPVQILRGASFPGMAGWFEVGDQDADPLQAAKNLQPAALRAGIATCILIRPGGHDFDLWSQALQDAFPWLSWRLGLSPEPQHEPATCVEP